MKSPSLSVAEEKYGCSMVEKGKYGYWLEKEKYGTAFATTALFSLLLPSFPNCSHPSHIFTRIFTRSIFL